MSAKTKKAKSATKTNKSYAEDDDNVRYCLTPKGIFWTCLKDAIPSLYDADVEDHDINLAWELFEARMRKHGYVGEDEVTDETK